jgi:SMC interacting uncharacterized protein involved in chromosome segregation
MKHKHDYFDNVLIKLKREYNMDELVASLIKQISEKDVLIGQLKSEIDELKYELGKYQLDTQEIKKLNKEARIGFRKDELVKGIKLENEKLLRMVRELRRVRDNLISKNVALTNKLNEFVN